MTDKIKNYYDFLDKSLKRENKFDKNYKNIKSTTFNQIA